MQRAVAWSGGPVSAAVRNGLERAGWQLVGGGDGALRVVVTRRGDRAPPAPAPGAPWVWASTEPVSAAAMDEATLRGALDCICLVEAGAVGRLARRAEEAAARTPEPPASPGFVTAGAVGRSVLQQVARAARTAQPVLITGETGTGKEVTARLIHEWSPRNAKTFVPVNCAAIPNDLMEAELFGYARGAFSGAVRAYEGQIAAAEGGTVLLDEIDDTPPPIQVKLLRVLEDRVVSRLGENVWRRVDFRLVASTNRDLAPLIADGRFGADLYERLAIVSIHLPPLRERSEDIPVLARHFVARYAAEERPAEAIEEITPEALRALVRYPWPGNIRELRNVIYQALVEKRAGRELLLSDLPRRVLVRGAGPARAEPPWTADLSRLIAGGSFRLADALRDLERAALVAALARASGNAAEAARLLGTVGRGKARDPGGTVRTMMRRLGVRRALMG